MNAHSPLQANDPWTWALRYAGRGWHVFPCDPKTKKPLTEKGFHDATTDADIIQQWRQRFPTAAIGCATGPKSGFWALDADRDKLANKDGVAALAQLGALPDTVEQATPRGGSHKLFKWDQNRPVRNSVSKLGPGIDTRGAGGYIILAPSIRDDGAQYQWSISPENGKITDAPDWLYEEIRKTDVKAATTPLPDATGNFPFDIEPVTETAAKIFKEQCLGVAAAPEGSRNDTLNKAAFAIGLCAGRGEISTGFATRGLLWAAGQCGLVDDDGENSARATIESGLGSGLKAGRESDPTRHHERLPGDLTGAPYDFPSAAEIEPRDFLYGFHYLRRYVSATIAPTKVGKSSLGVVEALIMASGKPLLGIKPTGHYRVRIWNGEDPREEMSRRIAAAMIEHGLTREDIGDQLLVDSGRDMPICTAILAKDGAKIMAPVAAELIRVLELQKVDVLLIDPFVKSHGVSENDNMAIDVVAREWNRIAGICNVAIDLVHHSRKLNGAEASIDDARGASALVSAARAARVLARMTKKEGRHLADPKQYRRFFRFADAVSNMALPAGEDEQWMEMKSVDLRNARFGEDGKMTRPSDQVGVVRMSALKGVLDAETDDTDKEAEAAALTDFASGEWREDIQARADWAGLVIARAYHLDATDADDKERIKAILKALIKSGKLGTELRKDRHRKNRVFVKTTSAIARDDLFE